jgi:hypothetical protein
MKRWDESGCQYSSACLGCVDSLIHPSYSIPPSKRWGSVVELTCHLQDSTPYGIKFSRKTYRPSPTKGVTQKDPSLIGGPLIGGYTEVELSGFGAVHELAMACQTKWRGLKVIHLTTDCLMREDLYRQFLHPHSSPPLPSPLLPSPPLPSKNSAF